jgi:predicted O-linked N-acetylglucosamine transferase (SPINDLY family)
MSSRVSASLLSALGASELIARTLDEYYKIARASRYDSLH